MIGELLRLKLFDWRMEAPTNKLISLTGDCMVMRMRLGVWGDMLIGHQPTGMVLGRVLGRQQWVPGGSECRIPGGVVSVWAGGVHQLVVERQGGRGVLGRLVALVGRGRAGAEQQRGAEGRRGGTEPREGAPAQQALGVHRLLRYAPPLLLAHCKRKVHLPA